MTSDLRAYEKYANFHLLRLSGSDAQMGYQHGQLLKEAIQRGPIPYFKAYLPRNLIPYVGPHAAQLLQQALYQGVGKKLFKAFPKHIQEHMLALAEGAEIPVQDVAQSFILPDLFLWLLYQSNKLDKPLMAPQMGCSSVFAQGGATQDGRMYHGRNLDYMGVGHWDAEATVIFYAPEHSQRYLSVTSAGIPLGGVTAMNEAGLTLAVHQHLSSLNVRLGGVPIGAAGDAVMRKAETIQEALQILEEHPPTACWTYLIASAHEKALLCYETSGKDSKALIVRQDRFAYTNFYLDPELAKTETHLYPSQWRSNLARYQGLQQHLEKQALDANDMAAALGSANSEHCRLSQPLSMLFTVSSAVFAPQSQIVYVAEGPAPTSQRPFHAFDLSQSTARPDLSPLNGGQSDPVKDRAFGAYRAAYVAWFEDRAPQKAPHALERACALQVREPLYHYMAGLVALDARLNGQAIHWLNKAVEIGHPSPERLQAFYLWRGRAYDAAGLRPQALSNYAQVTAAADAKVFQAAQKGKQRPWKNKALGLEFNYADLIRP